MAQRGGRVYHFHRTGRKPSGRHPAQPEKCDETPQYFTSRSCFTIHTRAGRCAFPL
jgi:hypothetical protein